MWDFQLKSRERRKFENRRKKEKNKSTFVYVNKAGDVTLFLFPEYNI